MLIPPGRNPLTLRFTQFRRLSLVRPLEPAPASDGLRMDATTPLLPQNLLQPYRLRFKDGSETVLSSVGLIDKPLGITSHDVVARLRRRDQLVAMAGKFVEQAAAQGLHGDSLVRQQVLDALRQQPASHGRNTAMTSRPIRMEVRPMKRIWPSVSSVTRRNVSRQTRGAMNGNSPSMTSMSANATNSEDVIGPKPYFLASPPRPAFFKYLKKSELGSITIRSCLFRNEPR